MRARPPPLATDWFTGVATRRVARYRLTAAMPLSAHPAKVKEFIADSVDGKKLCNNCLSETTGNERGIQQ